MIEITIYHEKDGELETSEYNNEPITEENLATVTAEFVCNFGFEILEIRKDGKILTEEQLTDITEKYPCNLQRVVEENA